MTSVLILQRVILHTDAATFVPFQTVMTPGNLMDVCNGLTDDTVEPLLEHLISNSTHAAVLIHAIKQYPDALKLPESTLETITMCCYESLGCEEQPWAMEILQKYEPW